MGPFLFLGTMQVDFTDTRDIAEYASIPAGVYLCRVTDVRESVTRDGNARWGLRLEVADGEYAGRTAGWDALIWSDRGMPRAKHVLDRFGFVTEGCVEIEPSDLLGRQAHVHFVPEEREDPVTGNRVMRLRVPYMGYGANGNAAVVTDSPY